MHARGLAVIGLLAGAFVAVTNPAPSAVAQQTHGPRCTIVGTRGPDLLTGTPRRDVICGRGGNDRINGRRGDDVILAGAGRDEIKGGSGNDRVSGAAGADVESGGTGDDVITGAGGDDVIDGGSGADDVDGGEGFNVCDAPGVPGDQMVRCVVDELSPVVAEVVPTPATVDVSTEPQWVRVEAHVTDDTGVTSVQIGNLASVVSGTPRDGIWAATVKVPQFASPGPRDVDIWVRDRVGRHTSATRSDVYTVVNSVTDQEMPELRSMSLSTDAVDVRAASAPVTATINVTDDLAGATDVFLCPAHAFPTGTPSFRQAGACVSMRMTSGTPADATWEATYVVPKAAPSGTWNFEVWISDAAGNSPNDFWFGPDELAAIGPTDEPRYRAIPGGAGVFSVLGTQQDLNAPILQALDISPSPVDTSTGAVAVTADIAATDVEGITGLGLFIGGYAGYPDNPTWTDWVDITHVETFQLISGTPRDGVWRATFLVPGGTPDGEYFIDTYLQDSAHFESWVSADSGWTTNNHLLTAELAPTGVHFVVSNSS